MREFERKKRFKKVLYSRTVIFILFLVLGFMINATWGVYKKYRLSKLSLEETKNETVNLDKREANLKEAVAYLNTDEGIEAEIRKKFRAVKPGEQVAVIVHNTPPKVMPISEEKSLWMKFKSFFGIIE